MENAFEWLTVRADEFQLPPRLEEDEMSNQYIRMRRFIELIAKNCQIKPVDFKKEDIEIYYKYVEQFKIEGDCITRDTFPGLEDGKTSVELLEKYVDYIIGFFPWELQRKALEISKSECLGLFFTYFDNWINGFKNELSTPRIHLITAGKILSLQVLLRLILLNRMEIQLLQKIQPHQLLKIIWILRIRRVLQPHPLL